MILMIFENKLIYDCFSLLLCSFGDYFKIRKQQKSAQSFKTQTMNLDLQGKHALVCGSTQGIGKAVAMELVLYTVSAT